MLTMSSDPRIVGRAFDTWRAALLEEGVRDGALWRLPEQRIVFRNQADARSERLGARTSLGTDPAGNYWAVQINEAEKPGDANVTAGGATDERGGIFLIRQGRLNLPIAGKPPILEDEFRRLTGLVPTPVRNGDTRGKRREWHVVTRLDVKADDVIVLQNAGPKGAPGMPEEPNDPLADLAQQPAIDPQKVGPKLQEFVVAYAEPHPGSPGAKDSIAARWKLAWRSACQPGWSDAAQSVSVAGLAPE